MFWHRILRLAEEHLFLEALRSFGSNIGHMSYHSEEKIRLDLEKAIPEIRTGESAGRVFGLAVSLFVLPVLAFGLTFAVAPESGTFFGIAIPLLVIMFSYIVGKSMDQPKLEPNQFQLFIGSVYWTVKHFREMNVEPDDKRSRIGAALIHHLLDSGPIKDKALFAAITQRFSIGQKKEALEILISHKFVDRFPTGLQMGRDKRDCF
jgi:hypothetical protein